MQDPINTFATAENASEQLDAVRSLAQAKTLPQVRFNAAPRVPSVFQRYGDSFSWEYPQLAVAIGGSLPQILDERDAIKTWAGGERPPGPLTRYPTRGA